MTDSTTTIARQYVLLYTRRGSAIGVQAGCRVFRDRAAAEQAQRRAEIADSKYDCVSSYEIEERA